ncbi:MAG: DNA primase [Acidobacteriota bacterium]|nr:DNA primase [Acidobacteriota bacterium]
MEITDKIKQVASIIEIASQYTTLKKRGKKWLGLCPFHVEKTPSFTVDEEKQLFHCFGCGAGGDLFSLVMEKENLTFPEAIRFLAEKYHLPWQDSRQSAGQTRLEEKIFEINEKALSHFRNNLFKTDEGQKALGYLQSRQFSGETIKKLRLGYALNSWDSLYNAFKTSYSPQDLEKAGLIIPGQRAGEFRDRFRGRIIFPIFTLTGRVVAFGGRTFFDAQPKYLNSPETQTFSKSSLLYGLNFTKEEIRKAGELILVEGYADFASLYQAGIQNVAASMGTSLTAQQIAQARRYAPSIIINYDGDEAGIKAALRAVPICLENGLKTRVVVLPEKLDPDGFLRKYGADRYRSLIKRAHDGFRFLLLRHTRNVDLNVPEEKSRLARMVVEEIKRLPDALVQNEYLQQAAEFLKIEEPLLRKILVNSPGRGQEKASREDEGIFCPAEKRLLQLLLNQPELLLPLANELESECFQGLPSEPVFQCLKECIKKGQVWDFSQLRESIKPRLLANLARTLQEEVPPGSLGEALDCLNTLKKVGLQKKLKDIQKEISLSEKKGDKERLTALLYEKHEITRQILTL